jgi:YidC/Oxa1 family membrane protein insertase
MLQVFLVWMLFYHFFAWMSPTPKQNKNINLTENDVKELQTVLKDPSNLGLVQVIEDKYRESPHYMFRVGDYLIAQKDFVVNDNQINDSENNTYKALQIPKTNAKVYARQTSDIYPLSFQNPSDHTKPIFLINMNNFNDIGAGHYQNGQFKRLRNIQGDNAIGAIYIGDKLVPVGVYKRSNEKLTLFQQHYKSSTIQSIQEKYNFNEKFYVIENDLMQVVLTNKGGSISEINLVQGKNRSIINKTLVDSDVYRGDSGNQLFPKHTAHMYDGRSVEPTVTPYLYPLLRNTVKADENRYAYRLEAQDEDLSNIEYVVSSFTNDTIVFKAKTDRRSLTKTFKFDTIKETPYIIDCSIEIEGDDSMVWLQTGVLESEIKSDGSTQQIIYQSDSKNKSRLENHKLSKKEELLNTPIDWVAQNTGYFGLITDNTSNTIRGMKIEPIPDVDFPSRFNTTATQLDNAKKKYDFAAYEIALPLTSRAHQTNYRIYAGPMSKQLLTSIDDYYSGINYDDYQLNFSKSMKKTGWFAFISEPLNAILLSILMFFHAFTQSWGLSIIGLTTLFGFAQLPLNYNQMVQSEKTKKLQPQIKRLEERYKDDQLKLFQEKAALNKKHGIKQSTMLTSSFIQMYLFFQMRSFFMSTFELRGASFGWIIDLSTPDVLFRWSTSIPFFGTELHLLPFLMAVGIFVTMTMTPSQKGMGFVKWIIPGMILFAAYNLPSGLYVYMISNFLTRPIINYFLKPYTNQQFTAHSYEK